MRESLANGTSGGRRYRRRMSAPIVPRWPQRGHSTQMIVGACSGIARTLHLIARRTLGSRAAVNLAALAKIWSRRRLHQDARRTLLERAGEDSAEPPCSSIVGSGRDSGPASSSTISMASLSQCRARWSHSALSSGLGEQSAMNRHCTEYRRNSSTRGIGPDPVSVLRHRTNPWFEAQVPLAPH